jgi:hypothetical protein
VAAQAVELVGRDDVFVGNDAGVGFLTANALLFGAADPFTAGPLPLFEVPASVSVLFNRSYRRHLHRL